MMCVECNVYMLLIRMIMCVKKSDILSMTNWYYDY